MSNGLSEDLKDLKEINRCSSCGKKRAFVCPKCGQTATLFRIKGNI